MYINHNSMATNVANTLTGHYGNLQTSTQRLSSGMRINSAADDAAGLAISELMRADVAALNQGVRNANDGIYDSTQRLMIESEYQQMASEITRIANATDFNGIKLLDGTLSAMNGADGKIHDGSQLTAQGALKVHFGTLNDSAEDYYYIEIGNCTASALGVGNAARAGAAGSTISTQQAAQEALVAINNAIVSKDKIRAHLGAMQNRLENTVTNLTVQSENLQAAESRIRDVDVATEMTNFVRNQVLTQSAVAMLSQANSMPQMALQLIG